MIKKYLSTFTAIVLLLTSLFAFAGCSKKSEASASVQNAASSSQQPKVETQLDKIKKAGKIVVGTSADYPPFEFIKLVNGKNEITGFDIAIAKEIAKDLGVQLEVKDMKFEGLLAALQAGNIDFVIAGMVPTPERAKSVDFSKIYYKSVQSVMVRAEDKDKLKSIADLKGKKVGAQKSTTQETIVKEQMKDSELKSIAKITDLVLELKNKKVDAAVIELPVATSYANSNPDIVVSSIEVENKDKGSAIAVRKGNTDLLDAINKTLDRLIDSNSIDKFVSEANSEVEQ